jgi:membrane-associated protein
MKSLPINVIKRVAVLILVVGIVVFLMTRHIDIAILLETGGIIAIAATIFAETGLLIGFFLPGDTLLFAAGFFAAQGKISLIGSLLAIFLGSILGNMLGYEIGRRSGPKIFTKEDALLLTPQTIESAQGFYEKHGGKTILLARFIPIVRTLAPLMAGIGKMYYKTFLFYNVVGAFIWTVTVTMIGYLAGRLIGQYFDIDKYLLPVILLATFLTFGASFLHILKNEQQRKILINKYKLFFKNFFKN